MYNFLQEALDNGSLTLNFETWRKHGLSYLTYVIIRYHFSYTQRMLNLFFILKNVLKGDMEKHVIAFFIYSKDIAKIVAPNKGVYFNIIKYTFIITNISLLIHKA